MTSSVRCPRPVSKLPSVGCCGDACVAAMRVFVAAMRATLTIERLWGFLLTNEGAVRSTITL